MVIFTTFIQIFQVFASIGLGSAIAALDTPQTVANPSKTVLSSLKCMLFTMTSSPLGELQLEVLLYVFSPIIKLLFAALYELARMIYKNFSEPKKDIAVRLGTAAVVLTLLEQPNIIGVLANSCDKLDPYLEDKFVKVPNTVQCYTPEYTHCRNVAVIPAFVFWGILVPFTLFYVLYKKRKLLATSERLFTVFGHLYKPYTEKAFYWGIFLIYFKYVDIYAGFCAHCPKYLEMHDIPHLDPVVL